jgi:hypothetical protein
MHMKDSVVNTKNFQFTYQMSCCCKAEFECKNTVYFSMH